VFGGPRGERRVPAAAAQDASAASHQEGAAEAGALAGKALDSALVVEGRWQT